MVGVLLSMGSMVNECWRAPARRDRSAAARTATHTRTEAVVVALGVGRYNPTLKLSIVVEFSLHLPLLLVSKSRLRMINFVRTELPDSVHVGHWDHYPF